MGGLPRGRLGIGAATIALSEAMGEGAVDGKRGIEASASIAATSGAAGERLRFLEEEVVVVVEVVDMVGTKGTDRVEERYFMGDGLGIRRGGWLITVPEGTAGTEAGLTSAGSGGIGDSEAAASGKPT